MVASIDIAGTYDEVAHDAPLANDPVQGDLGSPCPLLVSDNLGGSPAITPAELDAIERYFADLIDEALAGGT